MQQPKAVVWTLHLLWLLLLLLLLLLVLMLFLLLLHAKGCKGLRLRLRHWRPTQPPRP
jgi:hypothetical protein